MTATWEIETQFLPQYFNENKGDFLERLLSNGNYFLCEIFDMFGIDTVKNIDVSFIIWYKNAQHMMSNIKLPVNVNNRNELINFMSEYIFSRI